MAPGMSSTVWHWGVAASHPLLHSSTVKNWPIPRPIFERPERGLLRENGINPRFSVFGVVLQKSSRTIRIVVAEEFPVELESNTKLWLAVAIVDQISGYLRMKRTGEILNSTIKFKAYQS